MKLVFKKRSILPGFGLTLGYTVLYLSLIVLIPLSGLFIKTSTLTFGRFWEIISDDRVIASYRVTFMTAFFGAVINAFFGFIVAWTLVRYQFFGKKFIDAIVDLPFALPTAVSGIALTAIYAPNGWLGQYLAIWNKSGLRQWADGVYMPIYEWLSSASVIHWVTIVLPANLAIKAVYSPLGITIALTFIGLPFVVRTLQPALEDLEVEMEEASASLGATRGQTFRRVILPTLTPPLLTGFALAFSRALGEYGSVVFISGNLPMKTEISALLIVQKLEEFDYAAATAIATVLLLASFVILFAINGLQWWVSNRYR